MILGVLSKRGARSKIKMKLHRRKRERKEIEVVEGFICEVFTLAN